METYAFRFDAADRALVLSGDTAPAHVELARGADVLVHEANTTDARPADLAAAAVWERIAAIHCTPEQAGQTAHAAGVGHLVLARQARCRDHRVRAEAARCGTCAVGSASGGWGFGRRAFSFWIAPVSRAPTVGLDAGGGKSGGDSA